MTQQVAAYAAGKQDLAWDYIELFYHEQGAEDTGYVTEGYLQGLARQVPGLKLAQWSAERADRALRNEVAEDERSFEKLIAGAGLTEAGTPTFAIGRTGHTLQYFSPPSLSESSGFEEAIDKLVPRAG